MAVQKFIGIDIGGTTLKGITLAADGKVVKKATRATPYKEGANAVLAEFADLIKELRDGQEIAGIGVGTPGSVDKNGRVAGQAFNIQGWMGTDLKKAAQQASGSVVSVRNDGNLAAFAEWSCRGNSALNLLFVGLGTGVGGGFVQDGIILSGTNDKAVEIGHIVIDTTKNARVCNCGRRGCVEGYASGPAIASITAELASKYDSPLARGILDGSITASAFEAYRAFAQKDKLALAVHEVVVDALARAIAGALALLAPNVVVLGGGVLAGAKTLLADVAARAPDYVYSSASEGVQFEEAIIGPQAGLIGAALWGASLALKQQDLLELGKKAYTQLRIANF